MDHEQATPDPVDYAARAKALMKTAARAGALVIMPIGLAVSAHASLILPTQNISCNLPQSGCGASVTQLSDQGGLDGLTISASDQGVGLGPSGGTTGVDLQLGSNGMLTMDTSGGNCTGVGQSCDLPSVQVSWDASVSGGGGFQSWTGSYTVVVSLDGVDILTTSGATTSGADASTESFAGSATVDISGDSPFQNQIAELVSGSSGGNTSLGVSIETAFNGDGQNFSDITFQSADFTVTETVAATPEPSTMGLMLVSLLGLLGIGKRLRRGERA